MNSTVRQVLSFTIGISAGLAAGYLTAPRSGKKTREKIAKDLDEFQASMEKTANKKLKEARKILDEKVDEQVKKGKATFDKVKDAMTIS